MAPRRDDNLSGEPHSWAEYRLKILDLVAKHEIEIARLHDESIKRDVLDKARSVGWAWLGAIVGSIAGGIVTAIIIKIIHL